MAYTHSFIHRKLVWVFGFPSILPKDDNFMYLMLSIIYFLVKRISILGYELPLAYKDIWSQLAHVSGREALESPPLLAPLLPWLQATPRELERGHSLSRLLCPSPSLAALSVRSLSGRVLTHLLLILLFHSISFTLSLSHGFTPT